MSSEDTGAYGRDLGTNLTELLAAVLKELPADCRTMLRLGMTNPPFILVRDSTSSHPRLARLPPP